MKLNKIISIFIITIISTMYLNCDLKKEGPAGKDGDAIATIGSGHILIDGIQKSDPQESIYVRKTGFGDKVIILIPGNNCSGVVFEAMLRQYRGVEALNSAYTVYTFDYRGSGLSSYNSKITSLQDFAVDFEKVMKKIQDFPKTDVTIVGYSMGFAVALEMVMLNPDRYANIIGMAPVGTRGTRVSFNAGSAGADSLGHTYAANDWVPVASDADGLAATEFHQRSWQGANRTYDMVSFIWDMLVSNDILSYDINTFTVGDSTFKNSDIYDSIMLDVLSIQYMPESLYYCHKFNVSTSDATNANSGYGGVVTIPGDGRLGQLFSGKNVLLVKAVTDFVNWRGDQVMYDNYIATSKYDLKQAGATVTAVMINPNQDYDHGFPTEKPLQTVNLIDIFVNGTLSASTATSTLGASINFYEHNETSFETNVFTGF